MVFLSIYFRMENQNTPKRKPHRKSKNLKKLEEYKRIGRRLGVQGIRSEDSLFELLKRAMTKLDLMIYTNEKLEDQIRELIASRSTSNLQDQSKQVLIRDTPPHIREELISKLRLEILALKRDNDVLKSVLRETKAQIWPQGFLEEN